MNKVEYYTIEGKRYPLVFTFTAMEYIEEKYGSFEAFSSVAARAKTCVDVFEVLNQQGCAYVKWKSQDMPVDEDICLEPISREELTLMLPPTALTSLIEAITSAFNKSTKNQIKGVNKSPNGKSA